MLFRSFTPLAASAQGRVSQAILLGEDAGQIADVLGPAGIPVRFAASIEAALHAARAVAGSGDVVLLSPACASFDMFDNYEHRGAIFRGLVQSLV